MRHLGDISKINGVDIEPVDIITFGSPCQDLSVAGKRAGLKHEANGDEETTRSGLFMEAVRIIKEMRKATNGEYPRFALWENVPGAFSSNNGEDFRLVCEELIKVVEPSATMPGVPKNGWTYADSYIGDGWSLAYRVFDAQYWGVPQRRRRIHLVADFRGRRAQEVLFERQGVRGYFAQGRTPWQGASAYAQERIGADNREGEGFDGYNGDLPCVLEPTPINTLSISHGNMEDLRRGDGIGSPGQPQFSISCSHPHAVVYCDRASFNQGQNARYDPQFIEDGTCSTLIARGPGAVSYIENPHYIARRLTPTECARLQGFADRWGDIEEKKSFTPEEYEFWLEVRNTHAAINGRKTQDYTEKQMLTWYNKLHTDSAEYKMWGNGIALPPALYCMQGILEALSQEEDDDSWML
jgi:DNA (cytosine-5)-methyltransferase 1